MQNDGVEAVATADVASGAAAIGVLSINMLTSLQAWLAAPASNRGWVFLPTGSDGVDFYSAEGTTPPKLSVSYIPNFPPTISDIANQSTNEDTPTGAIPFTIGDVEKLGVDKVAEIVLGTNPLLVASLPSGDLPYYGYGAGYVRISLGDNWEPGGANRSPGGRPLWLFLDNAAVEVRGEVLKL